MGTGGQPPEREPTHDHADHDRDAPGPYEGRRLGLPGLGRSRQGLPRTLARRGEGQVLLRVQVRGQQREHRAVTHEQQQPGRALRRGRLQPCGLGQFLSRQRREAPL